jgi:AcrR family transcriptional regulator
MRTMGRGAETRDRIVTHALDVASVSGLDAVTIGELARELKLSKSGVFAHFRSKDELQLQVLKAGVEHFRERVVFPAFRAPRGEPRLRAAFDLWLAWGSGGLPGGCFVTSSAVELDDRPGPLRDRLAEVLQEWLTALERISLAAVEEGHLRATLDVKQFVFELYGIYLAFHFVHRTLRQPAAAATARVALDRLLENARAG